MPPPLHTLTGNLLCERTLDFRTWAVGATQRAVREEFNTRGKGVNVTNMLSRLGTASTALIFAGGATGAEAEAWLRGRGLAFHTFQTLAPSRTGTVIWSDAQPETTFLGPDAPPDRAALEACAAWLNQRPDGEVLALCGSFPGWASSDYTPVRNAITHWNRRGRLLADVYGPVLCELARQPAELIKINRTEFEDLATQLQLHGDLPAMLFAAHKSLPVRNWVITDGPETVWILAENAPPVQLTPPAVTEVSPTGSGDVLFACILHFLIDQHRPLTEAVRLALPYASANAAHKGIADFALPNNFSKA